MKLIDLTRNLKLAYSILSMSFVQILIGSIYSFSSDLLEQLRMSTSTIKLSTEEESWITSVPVLVCPIGLFILGILTDKIGRRKALQVSYIPLMLSWLIIIYSDSFTSVLIARIIAGLPFGSSTCEYVYIAEVCPSNMRQIYSSTVSLCVGVGMLVESLLSVYFDWPTVATILCGASVVGFVGLSAVPESPTWLRAHGRIEEARKADRWFDLGRATTTIAADDGVTACARGHRRSSDDSRYWSLFVDRTVWLPASVVFASYVCQQGSGVYALLFYSSDVFREIDVSWNGTVNVAVYLAVARVAGGLCFAALCRVRRKTLAIISGAGMTVSLFAVIVYGKTFIDVERPPFAFTPIVGFVSYMFFALLGVLPLPWILGGEVFPMPVRGVMNGVIQTCGFILWFVIVKLYPSLVLNFGVESVWSVFTAFCVLSIVNAIFIMPETNGKTVDEVLSYFDSHKKTIKK